MVLAEYLHVGIFKQRARREIEMIVGKFIPKYTTNLSVKPVLPYSKHRFGTNRKTIFEILFLIKNITLGKVDKQAWFMHI